MSIYGECFDDEIHDDLKHTGELMEEYCIIDYIKYKEGGFSDIVIALHVTNA